MNLARFDFMASLIAVEAEVRAIIAVRRARTANAQ
jgi:hypothetical protein